MGSTSKSLRGPARLCRALYTDRRHVHGTETGEAWTRVARVPASIACKGHVEFPLVNIHNREPGDSGVGPQYSCCYEHDSVWDFQHNSMIFV